MESVASEPVSVAIPVPTASAEPSPPQPTQREIGRARRQYLTKTFGKVIKCGHSFHPTNDPRLGCEYCWEAFFMTHEGVRVGVQSIIEAFGEPQLIKVRGERFTKEYRKFVTNHGVVPRAAA